MTLNLNYYIIILYYKLPRRTLRHVAGVIDYSRLRLRAYDLTSHQRRCPIVRRDRYLKFSASVQKTARQ